MSSIANSTYKALAVPNEGEPLQLIERKMPNESDLKPGQILVHIRYAGINVMDYFLQLQNAFKLPPPYVLGFEYSGTVVKVLKDSKFHIGENVFGSCLAGGCFAEYIIVNEKESWLCPSSKSGSVSETEKYLQLASTVGVAYFTAYESMYIGADIHKYNNGQGKGKTLFIQGISGAIGQLAAQIAKRYDFTVIGTSSKPDATEYLKNTLKVDLVINYKQVNVIEEVMKITNNQGCDLVYDPTYIEYCFIQSAQLVAKGGYWFRLGSWNMNGTNDEQARKIATERGAKIGYGDGARYWHSEEFRNKFSSVWKDCCEDFCNQILADKLFVKVNEVPLVAKEVDNALMEFKDFVKKVNDTRLHVKVEENKTGAGKNGRFIIKV